MKLRLSRTISTDTAIVSIIIAILVCARLVSFGYLSILSAANPSSPYQYPVVSGDSIHYATLGNNFLKFGAYQWTAGVPYRGAPPGYPALLAAIKAVTGSMTPIIFIQILCAAVATFLIYRMTRSILPVSFAWIPALGYALDPMTIFVDSTVVTDGLCNALLIAVVYIAFFQYRVRGIRRWSIVGVLLGLAIMVRPITEYLLLVIPALYLVQEWMRGMHIGRSYMKSMAVFTIACVLVIIPWMIRNEVYFGSFEVSNLGADDLLRNDARGFLAWRALADTPHPVPAILVMRHANDPIFSIINKEIDTDLALMTPPGGNPDNYEGRLALRYILHDPVRYAYFHSINMVPFFISSSIATYGQIVSQVGSSEGFFAPTSLSLLGSLDEIRHPHDVNAFMNAIWSIAPTGLEILWWIVVLISAVVGTIWWRKRFAVILCAVIVLYFAGLTGPMAASRYRIPAEPYLLILATVGMYALTHRKARS